MSWMLFGLVAFNFFIAGRQVGAHWDTWAAPMFARNDEWHH